MKIVFSKSYEPLRSKVMHFIENFEIQGLQLGTPKRNSIKVFDSDGLKLNIKSFKIPNLVNQFIYDTFRKSKAERSFNYANRLLDMGIDTPIPVAYVQNSSFFSFKESYFISEQLDSDYTFRDLSQNIDLENREQILKAFTRFTFNLHEKGIYFLDHSPGNTLVKIAGDSYKFYLVDLNRMEFKTLSFNERIQNFSRLTPDRNVISILSKEYARCIGADPDFIFERMWISTKKFQYNFHKKKRLKKSIRFWKN